MMPTMTWRGALLLAGLLLTSLVAWGQTPADALLTQAKTAITQRQWAPAATALETYRVDHPTGPRLAEATALLYGVYLYQGAAGKAEPLWTELITRWPRTEALWQAAETRYRTRAAQDPAGALAGLEALLTQNLLPPTSAPRAQALHLDVMEQVNPAEFCTRALAIIQTAKDATTLAELAQPITLARRVYGPLMAAKRFDEAKRVTHLLQERMALLGEATGGMQADAVAYFTALGAAAPARLKAELRPVLGTLDLAERAEEVALPVTVAMLAYRPLLQGGLRAEAKDIHTYIQAGLAEHGFTGVWNHRDTQAYLEALAQTDVAAFLAEGLPVAQAIVTAASPTEAQLQQAIARRLFLPLLQAGRQPEATALHAAVQQGLQRVGDPNGARQGVLSDYLAALEQAAPETFLAEALPVIATTKELQALKALTFPEQLAVRLYRPLLDAKRPDDARAVHATVAAARQRLGGRWNPDELYRYVGAWQAAAPDQVLPEVLAILKDITDVKAVEEAKRVAELAGIVYGPLLNEKRLAEAQALHTRVRPMLAGTEYVSFAAQELQAYLSALAGPYPAEYLAAAFPAAQAITKATTLAEAQGPLTIANQLYRPLLKAEREADVVALQGQVRATLTRLQAPEAQQALALEAYLRALIDAGAPRLHQEDATLRTLARQATQSWQADLVLGAAALRYPACFTQHQIDTAAGLYQDVQAMLQRQQAPVEQRVRATRAYYQAMQAADPARFLTEALPVAQAATASTAPAEVAWGQELATWLYRPLVLAKRSADAKALHTQVLAALAKQPKADTSGVWVKYFEALGTAAEGEVLAELPTVRARLETGMTATELQQPLILAPRCYRPLLQAGRIEDAIRLYALVEAAYGRLKAAGATRAAAMAQFYSVFREVQPDQYRTTMQAVLLGTKTVDDAALAAQLQARAASLYPLHAQAKQLADVQRLARHLEPLFAAPELAGVRAAHTAVYLGTLRGMDEKAYLAEALPTLTTACTTAQTLETLRPLLVLWHYTYEPLMLQQRVEDHGALHAAVQTALRRLGAPAALRRADLEDYTSLLARINPPQFLVEMAPAVETGLRATTAEELLVTPTLLQRLYLGLLRADRASEAAALHAKAGTALAALPDAGALPRDEMRLYWQAVAQAAPARFLEDGLAALTALPLPKTGAEAELPVHLLALAYPLLQGAQRGPEATAWHAKVQATLGTLPGTTALAQTDRIAYLTSLAESQPAAFITGAQPLLASAAQATSLEAVTPLVGLAKTAYGSYLQLGRIEDAKALHLAMQAAITKAGTPALGEADKQAYRDGLSKGAIEGIYALFKRAVAAGDVEGARKWLTHLNDLAPEHPRAVDARRLFKKMQGQ